jgi:DNA-binding MarR family transcriptional regulator
MAKKMWLTEDEQHAWIGLIATMTLLDAALDRQLQQVSGISHTQYRILAQLSQASGRTMHMTALATRTSSSQSRLSHAVARLEEDGYVERYRCADNKRSVHARLTDAGWALVVATAPGHVAEVRRLVFDHLTPEQVQQLSEVTHIVLDVLAEEGYDSTSSTGSPHA